MKSFIRLTDFGLNDLYALFKLADELRHGKKLQVSLASVWSNVVVKDMKLKV